MKARLRDGPVRRALKQRPSRHRVRGLATLEMVFCLPILLFVMALMINFGTASVWRIRGLAAARHSLWSSRLSGPVARSIGVPRPRYWPASAALNSGGDPDAAVDDPRVDQPVARGPALPFGTIVNRRLLDPNRGVRHGTAGLQRPFPLLRRLGNLQFTAQTELLDDKWQYWRMGLSSSWDLRVPAIYSLPRAPAALMMAYVQAAQAILRATFFRDLWPLCLSDYWPLDWNDEWFVYMRRFWRIPPLPQVIPSPPDFHPPLPGFCDLDPATAKKAVDALIANIEESQGRDRSVPRHMTEAFKQLYEAVINELQNQINGVPPPAPGQISAMQAEIAQLQAKIDVLNTFLQTLQ
jgi:hypothetical protein